MGGSKNNDEESLLEAIKFYQSGLLRYLERNDEFKMSHGLNKLSSYPIKISHLQDTGVGRTVNLLVKMEGKVGEQARSLIAKWKRMVEDEKEVQTRNSDHSDASNDSLEKSSDHQDKSTSGTNSSSDEESRPRSSSKKSDGREREPRDESERKKYKSSRETKEDKSRSREKEARTSDRDKKHSSRHEKESSSRHKEHSSRHEEKHSSKHEKDRSSRHEKDRSSRHEKEHSSRHEKGSSSENDSSPKQENDRRSKHIKENSSKQECNKSSKHDEKRHRAQDKSESSSKREKEHSKHEIESKENSRRKDEKYHKEKDRKSNKENNDKKDRTEKTKGSHQDKDESPKTEKDIRIPKEEKDDDKIKKASPKEEDKKVSSKKEKVSIPRRHITEISSSSGTSFEEAMGIFEMQRQPKKSSSKQIPSNATASSSGEPKKESKSDKKSNTNEKPKPSESKQKLEDKTSKTESSKKDKKSDKPEKESTSKHKKEETKSSESGTSFADALGQMDVRKKEKKSVRRKQESEEKSNNGYQEICSGSGASFEEALGMMEIPKKKRKLMDKFIESPPPAEKTSPTVPLPSLPLEKIEVNTNYLPPITPNYRPLNITHTQPTHNEAEFMDTFMKNKHHRTKIYSGNKSTMNKVPSLQDFCISLLQVHIDDMEATGGVPYSILKPVLEKATPTQLMRMEYYNSYLTEDSDELWKLHCLKDFKNKPRQECETWREMYIRCTDEREARFLTLTASIKEAKQKSAPIRTTKIAYINPPTPGARRSSKNVGAPMAKAKMVAMVQESKSSSDVVVTHQRKASRSQPAPSVSSQSKVKKMAPLMAKSLSAFKNRRYKR